MKRMNLVLKTAALFFALFVSAFLASAQQGRNLAQMLGYPADAKLLIIHADDMGLSHSVNSACIEAFSAKGITCGSIMETCPWALEINKYLKDHPEIKLVRFVLFDTHTYRTYEEALRELDSEP